jgi:hypothetical protein
MKRLVLALACLALLALPLSGQVLGENVKVYQVTVTGTNDVVVTFTHSGSTQISLCNTGSTNTCYVHFGAGDVNTATDMAVAPGACPPSLFVRTTRVAFHKGAGDTTVQMIVVYGRA